MIQYLLYFFRSTETEKKPKKKEVKVELINPVPKIELPLFEYFLFIPDDIKIDEIFPYLEFHDLIRLGTTCRKMRNLLIRKPKNLLKCLKKSFFQIEFYYWCYREYYHRSCWDKLYHSALNLYDRFHPHDLNCVLKHKEKIENFSDELFQFRKKYTWSFPEDFSKNCPNFIEKNPNHFSDKERDCYYFLIKSYAFYWSRKIMKKITFECEEEILSIVEFEFLDELTLDKLSYFFRDQKKILSTKFFHMHHLKLFGQKFDDQFFYSFIEVLRLAYYLSKENFCNREKSEKIEQMRKILERYDHYEDKNIFSSNLLIHMYSRLKVVSRIYRSKYPNGVEQKWAGGSYY